MLKETKVIYKYKKGTRIKKKISTRSNNSIIAKLMRIYSHDKRPFILFLASIILLIIIISLPNNQHQVAKPVIKKNIQKQDTRKASLAVGNIYASYFKNKNYTALWNLYTPSYQKAIQINVGKQKYLSFLQKKFADVAVQNYSLKPCISGQTIFPYGVERDYKDVCSMQITYALTSSDATIAAQLSSFFQVPLLLTKTSTSYVVVGGGPTDLQAPVLFPKIVNDQTITVPIVMYHRIAPMPRRQDYLTMYSYLIDVGLTVTPQNFASQMNQLETLHYHPISPNDLFNNLYYNLPLPQNPILLTFDDGRLSDFTYGLPILLQHHYTAMYMIPPYLTGKLVGYHNHNSYMSFAQLQIMAKDGMFIENHSLKHDEPLWNIPPEELSKQLLLANTELMQTTHYPVQFIAYPDRWPFVTWRQKGPAEQSTENVLSKMGFAMSFLDLGQNEILEDSQFPYQIPRIRGNNTSKLSLRVH